MSFNINYDRSSITSRYFCLSSIWGSAIPFGPYLIASLLIVSYAFSKSWKALPLPCSHLFYWEHWIYLGINLAPLLILVWILLYTHLYNFESIGQTFKVCNFTDKHVFLSLAWISLSLLIKLYFLRKLILMLLVVKAGRHWVCTSYCSQGQAGSRGRASRDASRSRGHSTCAQRGRGPSICLDAGALSASVAAGWKWRGVGRCKSVVYLSVL